MFCFSSFFFNSPPALSLSLSHESQVGCLSIHLKAVTLYKSERIFTECWPSSAVELVSLMQVCAKLKFTPPHTISHGEEVESDLQTDVWNLFMRFPPGPHTEHMDTVTGTRTSTNTAEQSMRLIFMPSVRKHTGNPTQGKSKSIFHMLHLTPFTH